MRLRKVDRNEAISLFRLYLDELVYGIDGYYERRIINAECFMIEDDDVLGICAIDGEWLTGLYIFATHRNKYHEIFSFVLRQGIKKILMTTKDDLLMHEIKQRGYMTEQQAYNFIYREKCTTDFQMQPATINDHDRINELFIDFITQGEIKLKENELFVFYNDTGELVSMGVIDPYIMKPSKACVGMAVNEKYRRQGYGVKTLQFLVKYLQSKNMEINARCWYKNTASRKTLLKAGFELTNELIRIEYVKEKT